MCRWKRNDDIIPSHHCRASMYSILLDVHHQFVDPFCLLGDAQIYRYEDNWASYPLAAWLAVTYVSSLLLGFLASKYRHFHSNGTQLHILIHSSVRYELWSNWLGPSERGLSPPSTGKRCLDLNCLELD